MPSIIHRALKALATDAVRAESTERTVTVPATTEDGFAVILEMHGDREFDVHADGWSERFSRAEDAYDCFMFLLSEQGRLKVTMRGKTPAGWQIERREYGLWVPGRPVHRRLTPIWRRAHTVW